MNIIKIPENLEKYRSLAEGSVKDLTSKEELSCELLAKSEKNNTVKELYLIYNPFVNKVTIDINSFEEEKDIYQLNPAQFILEGKSLQVFMVFSTKVQPLKIKNEVLFFNKYQKINGKLDRIRQKYNLEPNNVTEEIEPIEDPKQSIENQEIDSRNTVYLGDDPAVAAVMDERYYKINARNQGNIKMEIIDFQIVSENVRIGLKFFNNSQRNYMFDTIKLKFSDKKIEKIIRLESNLKVKAASSKEIFFDIPKSEIKDFDLAYLKIKVIY